uniref:Carnitine O-acetyltransferase n=1 Tax=Hadrurus spadix TaxID=141984 RepID=A0A1W7RAU9_9SCOR
MKFTSICRQLVSQSGVRRNLSHAQPFPRPFPKHIKGPMTAHQNDLPRQPVAPLRQTMDKYLKGVRSLLTQDEFQNTEKLVQDFTIPGGLGEKLHSVLIERYNQLDNWIEDWWLETDFLCSRSPLTTYANPGMIMTSENFKSVEDQIRYSANVLAAALEYRKLVQDHQLEPDRLRGQPMDMTQYFKIFSTCRLPGKECDHLVHYGEDDDPPKHIIVARNNRFFRLNVFDDDGNPLTKNQLLQQLQFVVLQSQTEAPPVGVLTTNYREVWADVYNRLCEDETNRTNVETLQKALFILSLDKSVPKTNQDERLRGLHNTIHGCSSSLNSGNRWMDKSFHIVVSENGFLGMIMEHSPVEAHPLTRLSDYILDKCKEPEEEITPHNRFVPDPIELRFNLNDQLLHDIEKAKVNVDKCCHDADLACLWFSEYGVKFLKSKGISTDSYIQMALQLAFYRLHGLRGVLYEVATQHNFLYGRMEIVHSTSPEAVDFCKAMMSNNSSTKEKRALLQRALKTHKSDVNEALNGNGMDCLMVGLKKAAIESGMGVPDIFQDIGFESYTKYRLVSSQAPTKNPVYPSYGPLQSDGYGIPYTVYPDCLGFVALSLKQKPETDSARILQCAETSLLEMKTLLDEEI